MYTNRGLLSMCELYHLKQSTSPIRAHILLRSIGQYNTGYYYRGNYLVATINVISFQISNGPWQHKNNKVLHSFTYVDAQQIKPGQNKGDTSIRPKPSNQRVWILIQTMLEQPAKSPRLQNLQYHIDLKQCWIGYPPSPKSAAKVSCSSWARAAQRPWILGAVKKYLLLSGLMRNEWAGGLFVHSCNKLTTLLCCGNPKGWDISPEWQIHHSIL